MNKIITTDITDPYLNLAIENKLLLDVKAKQRHLFLYRNRPCVVIGRFQNPWIECHLKKMMQDEIQLVRRQSGGGCVYHDLNNINFSFIADKSIHSQSYNHHLVVKALELLDIKAYATKRGDIRLNDGTDRKISGSAFKQKKDQAFHHGTMLVQSDLSLLNKYIHSDKVHLKSKSIPSTRSIVANITEFNQNLSFHDFNQALIDVFKKDHHDVHYLHIADNKILDASIFDYADKLKEMSWKFYETPKFYIEEQIDTYEFDLVVSLTLKKLKIEAIELKSYDLHPSLLIEYQNFLQGKELNQQLINHQMNCLSAFDEILYQKLSQWFVDYFDLDKLSFL